MIDPLTQSLIDGALRNGFGRRVSVQYDGPTKTAAFVPPPGLKDMASMGRAAAATHLGGLSDHALELGGLGLLSTIPAYGLYQDFKNDAPTSDKLLHGTELAGLGVLGLPALKQYL